MTLAALGDIGVSGQFFCITPRNYLRACGVSKNTWHYVVVSASPVRPEIRIDLMNGCWQSDSRHVLQAISACPLPGIASLSPGPAAQAGSVCLNARWAGHGVFSLSIDHPGEIVDLDLFNEGLEGFLDELHMQRV